MGQDVSDLPALAEAGLAADHTKGLCHSRQGTRPCQEGLPNLLSLLWQGRGHEASGSDVLAYPWAGGLGTSRELFEKLCQSPAPSDQLLDHLLYPPVL